MTHDNPYRPHSRSLWMRIRRSIWRDPWPHTERGRIRLALDDLILHLHAPRVPQRALKLTYSFGLGGLSILLFLVLGLSGILLLFVYTPTPTAAYSSIAQLETEIWMGQFVRNLHHWSGNLLLILALLHLLRVFFTAAFHPPREFNWILGLCLLVLIALSNFTGYLMPWDQLAYWATTIVTSMLDYIPIIGAGLNNWLLGGPAVGSATLRTFFALHVVIFPLLMVLIISYHIWRVRKDTFSLPRHIDEPPLDRKRIPRVTTIPHLVMIEAGIGLVVLALLFAWATGVDAPLKAAANPNHAPNPAKAAWYFMGFQELLLHFHPVIVTVVFPALAAAGLLLLPYVDFDPVHDPDVTGIWFRSVRGRHLARHNAGWGVALAVLLIVVDEYRPALSDEWGILRTAADQGIIALFVLALGLAGYYKLLHRRGATTSEKNLALFTLLLMAFITLTIIGIFFRGENLTLVFP